MLNEIKNMIDEMESIKLNLEEMDKTNSLIFTEWERERFGIALGFVGPEKFSEIVDHVEFIDSLNLEPIMQYLACRSIVLRHYTRLSQIEEILQRNSK